MQPVKWLWSSIINLIFQQYFHDTTICIIWNDDMEFNLVAQRPVFYAVVNIFKQDLSKSFNADIVNYTGKREQMLSNGVVFNDMVEKLTMSIEKSHCESFLAFQSDIPSFVEAFINASKYSIWRSTRNRFLFAYYNNSTTETYFKHYFFEDQSSILLIEGTNPSSTQFKLMTNKFVGPRAEHPERMYVLDEFDATNGTFTRDANLFPDKIRNLQGREVIIPAFDYRPYIVLEHGASGANVRDWAHERNAAEGAAFIDGTEARVLLTFCEIYNCTVAIDTSEADDWGMVYENMSGDGALGMVAKRTAEVGIGAMYSWYVDYVYLDMSMYLVRSGITCLVPAPGRRATWLLPLEPFQATLWCAVCAYLAIEILGLFFTHTFETFLKAQGQEKVSWLPSFRFGYITTFKLFISQSGNSHVESMTVRVLLFACFLNDIIITSIYGGGLASILTIPSFGEAADTLERLQSHKLEWAANSEAWVLAIRGSSDPLIHDILDHFHIFSDEALKRLALTEKMGFTLERLPFGHYAIADYLTQEAVEQMKIMQEDIYFEYTVAFVPRLWPLLSRFDHLIYMWHSSGMDKFWEWRIVADNLNAHIQKRVEASMFLNFEAIGPEKLGMSNFAGIGLVWFLGVVISTLVFITEWGWHRVKQKKTAIRK